MQTWIGTAGFRYEDWKGLFYPQRISKARMLPYYAEHFSATELDYGFQIPKAKVIRDWWAVTPERFRFSFEVPFRIRPTRKFSGCRELLARLVVSRTGDEDAIQDSPFTDHESLPGKAKGKAMR